MLEQNAGFITHFGSMINDYRLQVLFIFSSRIYDSTIHFIWQCHSSMVRNHIIGVINLRFAPTLHVFNVTVNILNTYIKIGLPGVSPLSLWLLYVLVTYLT